METRTLRLSQQSPREKSFIISIFDEQIDPENLNWYRSDKSKLWYYHLHYFDFLKQCDRATGLGLIENWIENNPFSLSSDAWEPYPISLRTVNWLIFFTSNNSIPTQIMIDSLYRQYKCLLLLREKHLLANHWLKNIVALLYLSAFFQDRQVFHRSLRWIYDEIKEQTSKFGMHYEYTPTYHALFVRDLMNVYDLLVTNRFELDNRLLLLLQRSISSGLDWTRRLEVGGKYLPIADVNYEGVPGVDELCGLQKEINIRDLKQLVDNSSLFPTIRHLKLQCMLLNAPFSPRYNAAHSHADKLSILLWCDNKPLLIDTGNYTYDISNERSYSRSVSAHSTIQVDNQDQAELWGAFRIGWRCRIANTRSDDEAISSEIHCPYYRHYRAVLKTKVGFRITDKITATGKHCYRMFFHFSPDLHLDYQHGELLCDNNVKFILPNNNVIVRETDFYPSMYFRKSKTTIEIQGSFSDDVTLETQIVQI